MAPEVQQAVDEPAREAVASAYPVHDMRDFIMAAQQELAPVMQAGRPAVVRGALRFTQRDREHFQAGILRKHSLSKDAILVRVQLAVVYVHRRCDAKRGL